MATSRHIDIGRRAHGKVRVIFHAAIDAQGKPLPPLTLADKVRQHMQFDANMEAMRLIDGPRQRGGFTATMRHAR